MKAILVAMGGTLNSIDSVVVVEDDAVETTLATLTTAVDGLAVFQVMPVASLARVVAAFTDEEDEQLDDDTRLVCPTCGRDWNVGDSDAENPDRYCSHDCELEGAVMGARGYAEREADQFVLGDKVWVVRGVLVSEGEVVAVQTYEHPGLHPSYRVSVNGYAQTELRSNLYRLTELDELVARLEDDLGYFRGVVEDFQEKLIDQHEREQGTRAR